MFLDRQPPTLSVKVLVPPTHGQTTRPGIRGESGCLFFFFGFVFFFGCCVFFVSFWVFSLFTVFVGGCFFFFFWGFFLFFLDTSDIAA